MSRRSDERGTAAVELVLVAPVFMVILLFVVGLGRMAHARQEVETAAADAARAGSLAPSSSAAATAAKDAARAATSDAGLSCVRLEVDPEVDLRPGGSVAVTVRCRADLSDVALAGFPGATELTARSLVPVEIYRDLP